MSYPDPEIVKSDGLLRLKWEEERERASCPDLLCFGTADMDYRSPEPVLASLKSVLERGHLGYPKIPDLYYETIHNWILHIAGWMLCAAKFRCLCIGMGSAAASDKAWRCSSNTDTGTFRF